MIIEKIKQVFLDNNIEINDNISDLINDIKDILDLSKFHELDYMIKKIPSIIENIDKRDIEKWIEKTYEELNKINEKFSGIKQKKTILFDEWITDIQEEDFKFQPENGIKGIFFDNYRQFCYRMDGLLPGYYIIAAKSNIGKTSFTTSLAVEIAKANAKKPVHIFLYTQDDSKRKFWYNILSSYCHIPRNIIDRKRTLKKYRAYGPEGREGFLLREDIETAIFGAYNFFRDQYKKNKFNIYDAEDIQFFEDLIKDIKEKEKKYENCCFFIDGIYNIPTRVSFQKDLQKFIYLSQNIKRVSRKSPVIITAEVKKYEGNRAPTREDIFGAGKFAFDADVVLMLYPENEFEFKQKKNMIVNFDIDKNKNGDGKGIVKMRFVPAISKFFEEYDKI